MTVATNLLTSNYNNSSASSYATASISPTANSLVLAIVVSNVGSPVQPTASGGGMSAWDVVRSDVTLNAVRITVFRALQASPTSGALTFDFGVQNQNSAAWAVVEFANVATGSNGANAVVQTAVNDANTTQTGITVTLGAFSSIANATFGLVSWGAGTDITEGSGFTEVSEVASGLGHVQTEFKATNDTSVDWTWASANNYSQAVALEIVASTESASASESKSTSASASKSLSPSASESASISLSGSPSSSVSASESKSASKSQSPSGSLSPSGSESKSLSPSPSASASESKSASQSLSPSASLSQSASASASPSPASYINRYSSVGNSYIDKYTSTF